MKKIIIAAGFAVISTAASGQGWGTGSNSNSHGVSGHFRSNGTYVAPSVATNPNRTQYDNYSTRGNVTPYNGNVGTRTPRY